MKRFVIALVILVVAVSVSICASVSFFKKTEALEVSMNRLLEALDAEDDGETQRRLDELTELWNSNENILHMVLQHQEVDEIKVNITTLHELFDADDTEAFREACNEALRQLENLRDSSRITAENIF